MVKWRFLALVLGSTSAVAGISPESPTSTQTATQVTVTYPGASVGRSPSIPRTATASTNGITVIDAFAITGGFASIPGVAAQRVIGFPAVGAAAAGVVAGCVANPVLCGVGALALTGGAAAFLEAYRVRGKNNTPRGADSAASLLQRDVGGLPVTSNGTQYAGGPDYNVWFASADAACNWTIFSALGYKRTETIRSGGYDNNYTNTVVTSALPGACRVRTTMVQTTYPGGNTSQGVTQDNGPNGNFASGVATRQGVNTECPSYFDFFRGVVPAGTPMGRDGKCPTGAYSNVDVNGVAELVTGLSPTQQADLNAALAAFNDWAAGSTACESCSAPATTLSGPATATPSPPIVTTTVDAAGSTVRTTTETKPLTYPASSPPTLGLPATAYIQIGNNSSVQSVLTPTGGGAPVTTTVTTSTSAASVAAAAAAAAASAVTQCDKFPDSAGCAKLGTATAVAWDQTNQTITMTPAAPWGSDNGACPAPQTLTLGGFAVPFDNTLMCQFFSGMRFAVLAAASIIAVMIFLGARGGAE